MSLITFTATATTFSQDSSPVFNDLANTSFSSKIDARFSYFNDRVNSNISDRFNNRWNFNGDKIGNGGGNPFSSWNTFNGGNSYTFFGSPSPVPEPKEYLLLLCGLGLIILIGSKRKNFH